MPHQLLLAASVLIVLSTVGIGSLRADSTRLLPGVEQAVQRAGPTSAAPRAADGPTVLKTVIPQYPARAHAAAEEGRVRVCFDVDETGAVLDPVVLASTGELFEQAVLDAVSSSRFLPARQAGIPVRSRACRSYRFILE
jgi:TonB family protein